MDSLLQNKNIIKLTAIFLAVLSLFFVVKVLSEFKSYGYIGNQYGAQNTISVTGDGEVFTVPDIAEITFDVTEEGKLVPDAQKKATEKMNGIIASLKKAGIAEKDIKTVGYNIYPNYEYQTKSIVCPVGSYCPQEGKQVLIGYKVSHSILLKVRKTEQAGTILSSLGTLEVTNLSGINFTIDDEDKVKNDAREKAITSAKEKADTLASQLGVKLVRIISFSEGGNYPIFYGKAMAISADSGMRGAPTPEIPAGENKITSSVTITYEIR